MRLTAKGEEAFDAMARAHEDWVIGMLAAMPAADRARLHALLGTLKSGLRAQEQGRLN